MSLDQPVYLTISAYCDLIGISRSTWHKQKRQGQTPPVVSIGGIQRIRLETAESFLAEKEGKQMSVSPAIH